MTLEDLFYEIDADLSIVIARFGGNEVLLERFIKKFPDDKNYIYLEKAVENNDYQEVEQAAHTLKGVAGNLGFSVLSEACAAIVLAVRQEKYESLSGLLDKVKETYIKVATSIKQLD